MQIQALIAKKVMIEAKEIIKKSNIESNTKIAKLYQV